MPLKYLRIYVQLYEVSNNNLQLRAVNNHVESIPKFILLDGPCLNEDEVGCPPIRTPFELSELNSLLTILTLNPDSDDDEQVS